MAGASHTGASVTRVESTIVIDAAPAKVFAFVAAEWETDLAFADGRRHEWSPERPARLRSGFRVGFEGELLALRGRYEVVVRDFVESSGWTANSTSPLELTWIWLFTATEGGCRITQTCEYHPRGLQNRLREWSGMRGRRAEAIEEALRRLKALVERQLSLERLERRRGRRSRS